VRITYVTEHFPPALGGRALAADRVVRHLRAAGHQVELVRPRRPEEDDLETLDEWRVGSAWPLLRGEGAALRRRWVGAGAMPHVVHVAGTGALALAGLRAARSVGVAASAEVCFHPRRLGGQLLGPLAMRWYRRLHALADCNVVPTRELAGTLAARGFEHLVVAGRGVDAQAFAPRWRDSWLRRDWHAAVHNPVLLFVGRLDHDKNAELALATFERLRQDDRALRMVVVGDGPLRARLQAEHPRAAFAGWQRGTELARHFASADVLLQPDPDAAFGSATLEAMASGLAVVAWDTAAAGLHIVDGDNGFLVPRALAGDGVRRRSGRALAAFVAATRRALETAAFPEDPLRRKARQAALRADWDTALNAFEQRLRQIATHARLVEPGEAIAEAA
jgi:glycosyltransferase involved in cell wall biosynthesis